MRDQERAATRDKIGRFTGITRKPLGCGRVQKAIRRAFIATTIVR
jgi:hypothetical protein